MPNRLAQQQSPYLLQHQHNPVDWYPWGEEAFARAREADLPIFLSVGYSTCHWCHVMAHESFESVEIAERLNRDFVPVKVDREERPDIDRVYMTFVQATTGSGGWPMSVWLTPTLEPFYGGTYYPPQSRWGRPGFIDVLAEISRAWREERARVTGSAAAIVERLRRLGADGASGTVPGPEALEATVGHFVAAFDQTHAGFGGAPKFPRPSELLFLLREHARTGGAPQAEMVRATLAAMADGGIHDHLGGGFHRYAVDAAWRIPHFEKMLYDQAQLLLAYLEAWQATGEPWLATVAAGIARYVRRDLADPEGGFYSAEDADSLPADEGGGAHDSPREGAFYVWTDREVREALGDDADVFVLRYGLLPGGNAPADPQGEFVGQNLLHAARPVAEVSRLVGGTVGEVEVALERARAVLLERRASRPRPHRDDKVLTAWNGLMIAALARAGRVLEDGGGEVGAAARAARFVHEHLWDAESGTLLRRYRGGEAGVEGYAEDYAYLVFGLLELFQVEGDPRWLAWALELQQQQDERFWDREAGGWFSTTGADPSVLLRLKDGYDGAEPAAGSVAAWNLWTLATLTGDGALAARLESTFEASASALSGQGRGVPMLAAALSAWHAPKMQVVVVGDPSDPATNALRREVARRYLPFSVVVPAIPEFRGALAEVLPWTASLTGRVDRPAAFLCRDFACDLPVETPEALATLLASTA